MKYLLMHKDIKVLKFELGDDNKIKKIIEIYDFNHMPFSTNTKKNDSSMLKMWWLDRSIPSTRDEYKNIPNLLPKDDSLSLVVKSHALSLTDQYWIKKDDERILFDDISFFSNAFDESVGDILFGKRSKKKFSYYSPDSTSTGNLQKRWKIIDGKKCLLKVGTKPHQYEIFSEIIASKIMDILDINHIKYSFYKDKDTIYCQSEDFLSYNEDFVSAYQLFISKKKENKDSLFQHLMFIYDSLGIPNYKTEIYKMLFTDFIIGNEDRHLNNFGVIRDAKTLDFIRIAPIYDSGSSLGFNKSDEQLNHLVDVDWKPFKTKRIRYQLDLISDFKWLNIKKLKTVVNEISSLIDEYSEYISKDRKRAIMNFLVRRINYVFACLDIDDLVEYNDFELSALEKQILKYVQKERTLEDIELLAKQLKVSYITAYRAVSELTKNNFLRRIGARKRGYWVLINR